MSAQSLTVACRVLCSMRIFLSVIFLLIVGFGIYFMDSKKRNEITLHFPLKHIWKNTNLINPEKLETIYEYYLLENLAVGLVSDDSSTASGYGEAIADSWEIVNDKEWKFHLNPKAKWSDGASIKASEIENHLVRISKSNSLHLKQIKHIQSVTNDGQWIYITFTKPVDLTILHELSLSDSFLLKYIDGKIDWSVTSGAFYVKNNAKDDQLQLSKNKHFLKAELNYPDSATLLPVPSLESYSGIFSKVCLLYTSPSPRDRTRSRMPSSA